MPVMNVPAAFRHVFVRLGMDNVRQAGDPSRWYARCPSHDDGHHSLSILLTRRGLFVKCHANQGCDFNSIARALGLEPADFWVERYAPGRLSGGGRVRSMTSIVKAYDYVDETGKLLYQNCRYVPKDFRARRPDPRRVGEWVWNLKGVRLVLYRLPDLIGADMNRWIFVVEGEKSADRLVGQLGVVATTNVGGAGKWNSGYTQTLKGRKVAVLYDFDEVNRKTGLRAGWEHGKLVGNALYQQAAVVRVVALPGLQEGQDVDDWLDAFRDQNDREGISRALWRAVSDTADWSPQPLGDPGGPYVRAVANVLRGVRDEMEGTRSPSEALGSAVIACRAVEEALLRFARDGETTDLFRDLVRLSATCQMIAEDIGVVPGGESGAIMGETR